MKIQVCLIEDEPLAREILLGYIQKIPSLQLLGVCSNALEAFALLGEQKIDLLFLDINLPDMNGMQFIKTLKDAPAVIFTTAYPQYALESYEINAIDYLLKPISFERFEVSVNKFLQWQHPSQTPPELTEKPSLFVRSEGKWMKLTVTDILFIEALKDYVRISLSSGQRITLHSTMKNMEERLKNYPNFIRIHKSYIVNLPFIERVEPNSLSVGGQVLVMGATYKDELMKRIGKLSL